MRYWLSFFCAFLLTVAVRADVSLNYFYLNGNYWSSDTLTYIVRWHVSGSAPILGCNRYDQKGNYYSGNNLSITVSEGSTSTLSSAYSMYASTSLTSGTVGIVSGTAKLMGSVSGTTTFSATPDLVTFSRVDGTSSSDFTAQDYTVYEDVYITPSSTQQVYLDGSVVFTGSDTNSHTVLIKDNGSLTYNYTSKKTSVKSTLSIPWYTYAYVGDVISIYADGQVVRSFSVTSGSTGAVDYVSGNVTIASGTSVETGTTSTSGTTASGTSSLSNYNGTSGTSSSSTLTRGDIYESVCSALVNEGLTKTDNYQATYEAVSSALSSAGLTGSTSASGTTVVSGSYLTQDQLSDLASSSSASSVSTGTYDNSSVSGTVSNRGTIDSVSDKQSQVFESGSEASDSLASSLSTFTGQVSSMPTSLGTVDSLSLGDITIAGQTTSLTIDLTKPWVGYARSALKAMVSLLFFVCVLVTVRRFL